MTLIPKPDKDTSRKLQTNITDNIHTKILYNILANWVQQTLKESYPIAKWNLSQGCNNFLISKNLSVWYTILTYWRIKSTWSKDAQHLWLSEKCKTKLQWTITSHLSQWPSSKCLQTINAGRGGGEKGTLLHRWKHTLVHSLGRTIWRFHKELKIEVPHDQEISLLSIYLEKTLIQKYTCIPMFTVSLFIIAKTWKWMDSFVHYII